MYTKIFTELKNLENAREDAIQNIERIILAQLTELQKIELTKQPQNEQRTLLRCIAEMFVNQTISQRYTMRQDFFEIFSKDSNCIRSLNNACKDMFSVVLKDPSPSGEKSLRINITVQQKYQESLQ